MDLPLPLNKNFNDISYKSEKSLLVELIFWTLKHAGEPQGPRRTVLFYTDTQINYIFEKYYKFYGDFFTKVSDSLSGKQLLC